MAAAKAQELRRLMKQQKNNNRKINHPLAKYNALGQVTCQICNTPLKNEMLWNTHLQSRKHKENVVALKQKSIAPKRPADNVPISKDIKKSKVSLPTDFFDQPKEVKSILKNAPPKSILKNAPPKTTKPKDEEIKQIESEKIEPTQLPDVPSGLPSDFFDKGVTKPDPPLKTEANTNADSKTNDRKRKLSDSTSSEQLPEGFFDDPKQDAKARNVEYKDPKEEEWEKFQKIIQEETKIAETIQEEEDEESEMLKDMDEFNNMKSCLSRVGRLKELINQKKSPTTSTSNTSTSMDVDSGGSSDESDDDEDIDGMFDWRAKMA
ncbi:zinc finger protein 830-like [Clytia hemisphaerica]|uniref:zinc finger protein 830-like n=1 Tax=Clytia hemisphaerica TaxID=252671 RepID=UPI0034D44877